jgi:hypothetical protein
MAHTVQCVSGKDKTEFKPQYCKNKMTGFSPFFFFTYDLDVDF